MPVEVVSSFKNNILHPVIYSRCFCSACKASHWRWHWREVCKHNYCMQSQKKNSQSTANKCTLPVVLQISNTAVAEEKFVGFLFYRLHESLKKKRKTKSWFSSKSIQKTWILWIDEQSNTEGSEALWIQSSELSVLDCSSIQSIQVRWILLLENQLFISPFSKGST